MRVENKRMKLESEEFQKCLGSPFKTWVFLLRLRKQGREEVTCGYRNGHEEDGKREASSRSDPTNGGSIGRGGSGFMQAVRASPDQHPG